MRGLIFDHLYGRVAYVALMSLDRSVQDRKHPAQPARIAISHPPSTSIDQVLHGRHKTYVVDDLPVDDPGGGWARFSTSRQTSVDLEHLGKSDEDLILSLPSRMKADLEALAERHRLTPSSYVRKLLVLELMGERTHDAWQDAMGRISADVHALERD